MRSAYVIEISYGGKPSTCFPVDLDTSRLVNVTVVSDYWARFIDMETGETHDCAAYYAEYLKEQANQPEP